MAARTDYDSNKYDTAAAGFKQALQVIAEIGPDSQTTTLADLKGAVERLRHACGRKDRGAGSTFTSRAGAGAGGRASAAVMGPAFYTLADIDVTPPVVVAQQIPSWTFTTGYAPTAYSAEPSKC